MTNLLQNKIAVITGANRGIGKSVTEIFAKNGANIIACMRSITPEIEAWMKGIESKFNISIDPVLIDFSDEKSIKSSIKEIVNISKNVDILVNNAGVASGAIFQMTPISELKNTLSPLPKITRNRF